MAIREVESGPTRDEAMEAVRDGRGVRVFTTDGERIVFCPTVIIRSRGEILVGSHRCRLTYRPFTSELAQFEVGLHHEFDGVVLVPAIGSTEGSSGTEERPSVESEGPDLHRAETGTVEDLDEGRPPIDAGFEAANRSTMPGTGTGPELTDRERAEQFRARAQAQSEIGQKVLEVYLDHGRGIYYERDANYRGDFWGDVIATTVNIAYSECTSGDAWEWTLDRVMRQVRRTRLECLEWESRREQLDPDDLDMLERRWKGHPESERPLLEAAVDWLSAAGPDEPASWQFVAQHSRGILGSMEQSVLTFAATHRLASPGHHNLRSGDREEDHEARADPTGGRG